MSHAMINEVFNKLLARYLDAAWMEIVAPKGGYRDDLMSEALATYRTSQLSEVRREETVAVLAHWINSYKVARAPWTKQADKKQDSLAHHVAQAALDLLGQERITPPAMLEDFALLREAIGTLYCQRMQKERQFTSLTAKVLWCFRQSDAPIYDDYAYHAVTALIKLYKALAFQESYDQDKDIVTYTNENDTQWVNSTQAQKDIWWFTEFSASHACLFKVCEPSLVTFLKQKGDLPNHVNAYRLFDKILWLYGNSALDFNAESQAERTNKT